MFNKLKQIKELRDQAKTLQNALSQETSTIEKNGIKITMDGNMNITEVLIEKDLSHDQIASSFKDAANEAIKKTQKQMAMKVQQMGGLPGM